jgi:hypothetical protein
MVSMEAKTPIFVETCIETILSARSGSTSFWSDPG